MDNEKWGFAGGSCQTGEKREPVSFSLFKEVKRLEGVSFLEQSFKNVATKEESALPTVWTHWVWI